MAYFASNGAALEWVSTPEAARKLQISETTLRRLRDRENGLIVGTHYKRGIYRNSPCRWNVPKIAKFIEAHAYTPRSQG